MPAASAGAHEGLCLWVSLVAHNGKLTPRQRRFVEAYLNDPHVTRAALKAGYSARSAASIGSELLKKPEISEALRQAQQEAARSAGVTLQRIMEEFAKLAFTNLDELVSWRGKRLTLKDSSELTPAQAAAIIEVSEHETQFTRTLKVKLYSKQAALESLLKCLQALDLEEGVRALEEAYALSRNGQRWH